MALDLPDQYPLVTLQESEPPLRQLMFPVGLAGGWPSPTPCAASTPHGRSPTSCSPPCSGVSGPTSSPCGSSVERRGPIWVRWTSWEPRAERAAGRASDGIALALRQQVRAPLLADQRLLESADDVVPQEG